MPAIPPWVKNLCEEIIANKEILKCEHVKQAEVEKNKFVCEIKEKKRKPSQKKKKKIKLKKKKKKNSISERKLCFYKSENT